MAVRAFSAPKETQWTLGIGYVRSGSRRNSLKETLKNVLDCCVAISLVSRTAIRSQPSRRWRKWPERWRMPLYQLMYDGQEPPALPPNGGGKRSDEWGAVGKDARFVNKLCLSLAKMSE